MTQDQQGKPREFWIDPVNIGRSMNNRIDIYSCSSEATERNKLHVIEYSAYRREKERADRAEAEIYEEKSEYSRLQTTLSLCANKRDELKAKLQTAVAALEKMPHTDLCAFRYGGNCDCPKNVLTAINGTKGEND